MFWDTSKNILASMIVLIANDKTLQRITLTLEEGMKDENKYEKTKPTIIIENEKLKIVARGGKIQVEEKRGSYLSK